MLTSIQDPIVEGFRLPVSEDAKKTMKFVKAFMDSPQGKPFQNNPDGAPGVFVFDSRRPIQGLHAFGFEGAEAVQNILSPPEQDSNREWNNGDLVIIQARPNTAHGGGSTALGRFRTAIRQAAVEAKLMEPLPQEFEFLWVTDFPLFTLNDGIDPGQGGASGFSATHHPFTAPKTAADVDLLLKDPLAVTADHYDLVVNGVELGGGSRRIHNSEVQQFVMREILQVRLSHPFPFTKHMLNIKQMSEERMKDFSHLFEALRAGCPPHAGFALGFDRLMAVLSGQESVKEVIAFPKSSKGEDLLVKSPSFMTPEQQATYHLKVVE
jgi:aspartyl-tRNA synthetase